MLAAGISQIFVAECSFRADRTIYSL